jgi:histone acetyltransferase (RNA polymerase elongator complex component)
MTKNNYNAQSANIKANRHTNVAIFVPHAGCPYRCSFCNQCAISGAVDMPTPDDVVKACKTAVTTMQTSPAHSEIAFFGGSFTAIPRDYMISLLDAAFGYVGDGKFKGIRISTRPDTVDKDTLKLLKDYGVTAIELGAQSMDDDVLSANHRGHTATDVVNASKAIHDAGIELGLQMMTGLYMSDDKTDIKTAHRLAELNPATIRIYPTLVMERTALASLYRAGKYTPQSLDKAVNLCAVLIRIFEDKDIKVIRLGLHSGTEMQTGLIAGPWHPAFRELCESRIYFDKALPLLWNKLPQGGSAVVAVNPRAVSKIIGQNRSNISLFLQEGYDVTIQADPSIKLGDLAVRQIQA